MDTYFKICQAKEEIKRLNIEIQRVITYMHIEDTYLRRREGAIAETEPALAFQISRYRQDRERFYAAHMHRFYALSKDAGFTGSVEVGVAAARLSGFGLEDRDGNDMSIDHEYAVVSRISDADSDDSDYEDGEDAVHEQVQAIMQVSEDTTRE
ncbi:uncharacterized protein EV420DRAFT_1650131 [Desarmillaria tabescens]|uniref:Uncharacterized protein n=1 Tax=Armillaria tabescens TaxID=1929756 RepID=A0AA39JFW4_ARMTA|nr:uncharacterized protein EV420DRAFT_1650131 [Desarmillaria tabescens]KAK0441210.1 hypothetical protein EV420DRAFT_1650131 [Desarmillaria tabescens]